MAKVTHKFHIKPYLAELNTWLWEVVVDDFFFFFTTTYKEAFFFVKYADQIDTDFLFDCLDDTGIAIC